MRHECMELFTTQEIDDCSGEGYNRCYGIFPMILEVWFMDQDGLDSYRDNWQRIIVKFCPYCGLKSE
jgi:hypothetical protein